MEIWHNFISATYNFGNTTEYLGKKNIKFRNVTYKFWKYDIKSWEYNMQFKNTAEKLETHHTNFGNTTYFETTIIDIEFSNTMHQNFGNMTWNSETRHKIWKHNIKIWKDNVEIRKKQNKDFQVFQSAAYNFGNKTEYMEKNIYKSLKCNLQNFGNMT